MNPLFWADFYKLSHVDQYPSDTQRVWSNWTARSTRVPDQNFVINFGLQYFIKSILIEGWQKFFWMHRSEMVKEYREAIFQTLGVKEARVDHLEYLHSLGHLPLDIYALPEGHRVSVGVPMLVITNTDDKCFWLPNFLETVLSAHLWKPTRTATKAHRYRQIFLKYAQNFGEKDLGFVDWQGHDFSYRGLSGNDDAIQTGMAHLLSFNGTDTIPAILAARKYYAAPLGCGGSVPATEHSVMCAGTQEGEFETFKRLITEIYKTGIVSIVSDTWDLWRVLTDYVPRLKSEILARNGKLVIRPDSGDPVKIILGDPDAPPNAPAREGALVLLAKALGTDGHGHINKAGLIYGDGISEERAEAILKGAVEKGFSPYNIVFGIGSYSYEHTTRDEYNMAMKATAVMRGGKLLNIFKKPVTDNFHKSSLVGIPIVYSEHDKTEGVHYFVKDHGTPEFLDKCDFRKVYGNGRLLIEDSFGAIRERVRA